MKKKQRAGPKKKSRNVIALEDLAPRKAVVGGSGKLLFGERLDTSTEKGSPEVRKNRYQRDSRRT